MSSLYQKMTGLSKGKLAHPLDTSPSRLKPEPPSGTAANKSIAGTTTAGTTTAGALTHQSGRHQPGGQLQRSVPGVLSKPLIHILDYGEKPGDMASKPHRIALNGQTDVYITRAEMELRKAMQSLAFMTHSEINSVTTLTAMSLPKAVTPLFWTIRTFLQEKYQKPNDTSRIHHRNQDARLLYQQLARLDLRPWSNYLVDYLRADALPDDLIFPLGHPIRGRTYRRHPFKSRRNYYYPVTDYFSLLFEEREQALLSLLWELGATNITMTMIPNTADLDCQAALAAQLRRKVFAYPAQNRTLPTSVDLQRHPWLAGEPAWQSMVRERLERRARSVQFEFNSDVMGMLKAQMKMVGQLVPGLSSMVLPESYEELIRSQILKTRQVKVEFCDMQVVESLAR